MRMELSCGRAGGVKRKEGGRRKKRRIKRRREQRYPKKEESTRICPCRGGGMIPQEDGADLL